MSFLFSLWINNYDEIISTYFQSLQFCLVNLFVPFLVFTLEILFDIYFHGSIDLGYLL